MFRSSVQTDPTSLINARLSFSQLLLLLSYVLLESSLPAKTGDIRQLKDIIRRNRNDWRPQIGQESYPEMKQISWHTLSLETREAWGEIREYLVQQNLINPTVSSKELRVYLCQILCHIEQISAQGLNTLCDQSAVPGIEMPPLSEKASLVLVCRSVCVISTPGGSVPLRSLLEDSDQHLIREMGSQLRASPLFRDGVSLYQLWDAFASLDLLLCSRKYNVSDPDSIATSATVSRKSTFIIKQQETKTW
ncbi:hypothetical protein N7467_012033 [Penicillium canescens]|nr:hypothetical protein N7467_012033 [Penicillium canescens]